LALAGLRPGSGANALLGLDEEIVELDNGDFLERFEALGGAADFGAYLFAGARCLRGLNQTAHHLLHVGDIHHD
jgi:hypothetical protein